MNAAIANQQTTADMIGTIGGALANADFGDGTSKKQGLDPNATYVHNPKPKKTYNFHE